MKKLMQSLLLSTALLGTAAAYADDGQDYHHGKDYHHAKDGFHHTKDNYRQGKDGKSRLQYLEKKLDLSAEQTAAIEAIHSAHAKGDVKGHKRKFMQDIAELDPASPDYQEQVAAIAKEQAAKVEQSIIERGRIHAQVYEVLTPEQRTKLKELKAKRKERMSAPE